MRNTPIIICKVQLQGLADVLIDLSQQVIGLKYEDCADKADKLTLQVANYDLANFDYPYWRTGNFLFLRWGYPELLTVERKVQIRKVTGFQTLQVEAYGGELLLSKEVRVRTFRMNERSIKYSDVARVIAMEWGYNDAEHTIHIEDSKTDFAVVHQKGETDLELMNRMKRETHFDFYVYTDGFHFHSREWMGQQDDFAPIKTLTYNSDQSQTEILSAHLDNDVTVRPGSVGAGHWRPIERHGIHYVATNLNEQQKKTLAERLSVPGYGEWVVPGLGTFGQHLNTYAPRTTSSTPDAVAQYAEKLREDAIDEAVKLKITTVGDPTLLARFVIEIRGMGRRLSQRYWVRNVEHHINNGYTCEVECVSSGHGGHDTKVETPIGVVALEPDPKNLNFKKAPAKNEKPRSGIRRVFRNTKTNERVPLTPEQLEEFDKTGKVPDGLAPASDYDAALSISKQRDYEELQMQIAAAKKPIPTPLTDTLPRTNIKDGTIPSGVGDSGVNVPVNQKVDAEVKTNVEAASQQDLMKAYESTRGLKDPWEEDHTRQYLYDTADYPGNLDLDHRPVVPIEDEEGNSGVATVRSISFQPYEHSDTQIVIPTVAEDGHIMTDDEAVYHYEQTGRHLGFYKDIPTAEAATQRIHLDQIVNPPENTLAPRADKPLTPAQRRQQQRYE